MDLSTLTVAQLVAMVKELGGDVEVSPEEAQVYFPQEDENFYIPKVSKDFYVPSIPSSRYIPKISIKNGFYYDQSIFQRLVGLR